MNEMDTRFANQFNIQWFPGHMTKTLRMMEQEIQHVDASLVLLDARIPLSSLNPEIERITARSEISKPSGRIRCRRLPVAAQVRAILPQFWGISGSTNTIFSTEPLPPFPPLRAHRFIDSCIVMQSAKKCNYNLQNPHIFS